MNENEQYRLRHVKKTEEQEPSYIEIDNSIWADKRLSLGAKGLMVCILSMPDDWVFNREELLRLSKNGRCSLNSFIKELINCSYIKIVRKRDAQGRVAGWDTFIFETPELYQKHQT